MRCPLCAIDDGAIPIIALTANATKADRDRCLAAGMDDYVIKPFRAAELFRAVERLPLPIQPTEPVAELAPRPAGLEVSHPRPRAAEPAQVLDWEGAVRSLGDEALLRKMAAIDAAIARGDAPELRRAAHTLKGSAQVVDARAAAQALETILRCLSRRHYRSFLTTFRLGLSSFLCSPFWFSGGKLSRLKTGRDLLSGHLSTQPRADRKGRACAGSAKAAPVGGASRMRALDFCL